MGMKHSTVKSFGFAFQGMFTALKSEPNLRIHFFMATLAITIAVMVGISALEWLLLVFTIFYVITLELMNTVLESLVNLVSPDIRPEAKVAKDVSAAFVLLAAIFSLIVGGILFLPKILAAI